MKFNIYCFLALTFLISGIYLAMMKPHNDIFIEFMNSLNPQQKILYEDRIKERLNIYLFGIILGIFLATVFYYYNKKSSFMVCKFIAIIYLVKLSVYYFTPKSPLMLNYLTDQKQVQLWAKIYKTMKNRWIYSLIFGTVGYFFVLLALEKDQLFK